MYERYKLLKKTTITTYLTVIMIISFYQRLFYSALFHFYFIFKSGFTPCADIVNQISARQGIRLTTLIRHESEKNAQSWMTGRNLICSTRELFVVPAFRLIYKLFEVNFFPIASRSL